MDRNTLTVNYAFKMIIVTKKQINLVIFGRILSNYSKNWQLGERAFCLTSK